MSSSAPQSTEKPQFALDIHSLDTEFSALSTFVSPSIRDGRRLTGRYQERTYNPQFPLGTVFDSPSLRHLPAFPLYHQSHPVTQAVSAVPAGNL